MVYATKTEKCPNCNYVISKHRYSGSDAQIERALTSFGPIFNTCPKCGTIYKKSDTYELAVMDPPKGFLKRTPTGSKVFIAIFALLAVYGLFGYISHGENPAGVLLVCLGFIGFILFSDKLRFDKNQSIVEKEYSASVERLKNDRLYGELLKKAGYIIPPEIEEYWQNTEQQE